MSDQLVTEQNKRDALDLLAWMIDPGTSRPFPDELQQAARRCGEHWGMLLVGWMGRQEVSARIIYAHFIRRRLKKLVDTSRRFAAGGYCLGNVFSRGAI